MDNKISKNFISLFLFFSLLCACSPEQQEITDTPVISKKIDVTVSILPQQYFVERIGREYVDINLIVEPGQDPHNYQPTQEQIADLINTKIYFTIGLEFENFLDEALQTTKNNLRIVDTSTGVDKISYSTTNNAPIDPHIWTSPNSVKIISKNIYAALVEADPDNQDVYYNNFNEFISDINLLEEDLNSKFTGNSNNTIMVYHPAWEYFARDFGLNIITIEVNGQEPDLAKINELILSAKKNKILTIYTQPDIEETTSSKIAIAVEGKTKSIDPLAYDWINNLTLFSNMTLEDSQATILNAEPLKIAVSIPPLKYFAERIGGRYVDATIILPEGANPLTYKTDPNSLLLVDQNSAYFTTGLPFEEEFVVQLSKEYPDLEIIDTTERVNIVSTYDHYKVSLAGFPEVATSNELDPHIWMSPAMARSQAEVILDTLTGLDPARDSIYRTNYRALTADIDELLIDSKTKLTDRSISKFMILHPALGYYGDEYKLEMLPINKGTRSPVQNEIIELIVQARVENINTVFVQPQFDSKDAQIIANELKGKVVMIDPLSEDWLDTQITITDAIAESIK